MPDLVTPWFEPLDADLKGFLQIKGLDKAADPLAALTTALGSYREAEKKLGVPADRVVRWPEPADTDGMKPIYQRLGMPADATGYDFSTIKNPDGSPLDPTVEALARDTAFKLNLPKDAATGFVAAFVKHQQDTASAAGTAAGVAAQAEDVKLRGVWGDKYDFNKVVADRGAQLLGLPEPVAKLMQSTAEGYEALRRMAAGMSEASLHGGGPGGNAPKALSPAEARATLEQKMADPAWKDRYFKGEAAAVKEWADLNALTVVRRTA